MSDHKKCQAIKPDKVCWHYTKGFCIYGGKYKFQHVKQNPKVKAYVKPSHAKRSAIYIELFF